MDLRASAMISAREIALEMEIEPILSDKRRVCRKKKQFDDNVNNETILSVEELLELSIIYIYIYI